METLATKINEYVNNMFKFDVNYVKIPQRMIEMYAEEFDISLVQAVDELTAYFAPKK